MQYLNLVVLIGGIVYGVILVIGYFVRNKFFEFLRFDPLIFPKPTDKTRLLNPIFGAAIMLYNLYVLFLK